MTSPDAIPQPEAEDVTFQGSGVRLAADRWYCTRPHGTVILLHGGGQTRHSWHRAGPRLAAAGWNAVSVDQRGHGDSEWAPGQDYSIDAMEEDLLAVIDQVGGPPPVLVGASMGGSVSLLTTSNHPDLVRALVLVDIVPRIEPAGVARITGFMRGHPDGFANLDEVAAAVHAYNPHRSRPATPDGLRKNVRQHEDGRWYWHWDPAFLSGGTEPRRGVPRGRMLNAARNITVPTLLVRGKQSDIVSDEGVRELLELVPGARYVDISGAGHMVAGDDNDVFSSAVLDFLTEL
ncbi:MAG TPA: alpha/beta hydrolase [Mycobacteriales bacterium]|nr:alpha/beta hydrolase [Mycobacteriales bacterium]